MAEMAERVGTRMRQRREELRLTQAEVANRIEGKTTSDQVSRWERGRHQPNDLGPIAKALEVDVSYFYAPALPSILDGSGMDTPDLFATSGNVEGELARILEGFHGQLAAQTEVLGDLRDTLKDVRDTLKEVRVMLGKDTAAADRIDRTSETLGTAADRLDAQIQQTIADLQATAPKPKPRAAKPDRGHARRRKAPAAKKTAPKGSPRAAS